MALCVMGAVVNADEIVTGGVRLERVRITDLDGSNIAYRTPASEFRLVPIADVERLTVDTVGTLNDLNDAEERAAKGDYVRAMPSYERAIRVAADFWKRLARARLMQACDRAGRMDTLVDQAVMLLRDEATGPALVAALLPIEPSSDGHNIQRALRAIDQEVEKASSQSARVVLESFRFDLSLRAGGKDLSKAAADLAGQPIPAMAATRRVYRVRGAALAVMAKYDADKALDIVDDDLGSAPMSVLPELLMVKARILVAGAKEDAELLGGAAAAMRIVIHYPDDPLGPQALILAAHVHEQIGRAPTAIKLLNECMAHKRTTGTVREEVAEFAKRLGEAG